MKLITLTLILLMLLIPLPSIVLEILWGTEVLFAIMILFATFADRKNDKFSAKLLYFSLFSLALNIALLRFGLSSILRQSEGISLIGWFDGKVIDKKYLLALIISIPLIIADILLVSTPSFHVSEVSTRFALDSMNTKIFDIDNRLHKKEIPEEEADRQKKLVQKDVDSKSKLAGAAKFLSGCVKACVLLLVLHLVIGTLLGIFASNYYFFDSLKATVPSFCVCSILFTVPQIIVGIAMNLKIKRKQF